MKQLRISYLFLFISPRKNLLFTFFLLLILSFTGCKSVVEEPIITQKTVSQGVLYFGISNGLYDWYDEKLEGVESEDNRSLSKYEGEIKNGFPNGQGTFSTPNGRKYVGGWKNGKQNGQGSYTYPDGRKYVGEWKDGKEHAQGVYTWSDGDKYEGKWKHGKMSGQGTYTWSDGRKYVGEYKAGKKHGQGTYTWSDGRKYVGEYKNEIRHGQGTYTFPSGDNYFGEWMNGNPWNITGYDKNRNILGYVVNGKQQ